MSDDGVLVLNGDDDFLPAARPEKPKNVVYFAIKNQNADVVAKNIQQQGRSTAFVISDKKYGDFNCVIPTVGNHNVMDAMSAYAVATRLGFDPASGLQKFGRIPGFRLATEFCGKKRRFDYRGLLQCRPGFHESGHRHPCKRCKRQKDLLFRRYA